MTKEETKKAIEVMQAYVEGKVVQSRPREVTAPETWFDHTNQVKNPVWNWDYADYRVKPEPMEFWINVYPNGQRQLHETKESAERNVDIGGRTICVREVLK